MDSAWTLSKRRKTRHGSSSTPPPPPDLTLELELFQRQRSAELHWEAAHLAAEKREVADKQRLAIQVQLHNERTPLTVLLSHSMGIAINIVKHLVVPCHKCRAAEDAQNKEYNSRRETFVARPKLMCTHWGSHDMVGICRFRAIGKFFLRVLDSVIEYVREAGRETIEILNHDEWHRCKSSPYPQCLCQIVSFRHYLVEIIPESKPCKVTKTFGNIYCRVKEHRSNVKLCESPKWVEFVFRIFCPRYKIVVTDHMLLWKRQLKLKNLRCNIGMTSRLYPILRVLVLRAKEMVEADNKDVPNRHVWGIGVSSWIVQDLQESERNTPQSFLYRVKQLAAQPCTVPPSLNYQAMELCSLMKKVVLHFDPVPTTSLSPHLPKLWDGYYIW